MKVDKSYQEWWNSTWGERERLFKLTFGETSPSGKVVAFSWDDISLNIPGACAMRYPPQDGVRPEWLTLSHGLSQPYDPDEVTGENFPSSYGFELGFLTSAADSWCIAALYQLLTYIRQSEVTIDRGNRVPICFFGDDADAIKPVLGKPANNKTQSLLGECRALLFWPYMKHPAGLATSTGYFNILIGTAITLMEWELAKATSSSHLLLLLSEAGVCQRSDIYRSTITLSEKWKRRWNEICKLSESQADELLLRIYCYM